MPANKKPRKAYRPRRLINTLGFAIYSVKPLPETLATRLRIRYHDALEMLRTGQATFFHLNNLVSALNIADALALSIKVGNEYADEIRAAQDALYNIAVRGADNGRFILKGPELAAIVLGLEVFDAQIDVATTQQIEQATHVVDRLIAQKKARTIPKSKPAGNHQAAA